MNGIFSAQRTINHFELDNEKQYDRQKLMQDFFRRGGRCITLDIYAQEDGGVYYVENHGEDQDLAVAYSAQAVVFYGESIA